MAKEIMKVLLCSFTFFAVVMCREIQLTREQPVAFISNTGAQYPDWPTYTRQVWTVEAPWAHRVNYEVLVMNLPNNYPCGSGVFIYDSLTTTEDNMLAELCGHRLSRGTSNGRYLTIKFESVVSRDPHPNFTIKVSINSHERSSQSPLVWVFVGFAALLLVIGVVLVIFFCCPALCCRKWQTREPSPDHNLVTINSGSQTQIASSSRSANSLSNSGSGEVLNNGFSTLDEVAVGGKYADPPPPYTP